MANAEGGSLPSGVGVSSPSGVRILAYFESHRTLILYLHDDI